MSHYYQIVFSILFINVILIQSTVILVQSSTNTQIISPSFARASLSMGYNYADYIDFSIAPNAKWIWHITGRDCGCPNNITIQHFFKLNCLTSKIYLYIDCDDFYYVYLNGVLVARSYTLWNELLNYTVNTSNNGCDDIFNLTIYAQNDNWADCCNGNPAGLIYAVISDDCNNTLCQCNNLVYSVCSSANCIGPVNYITDQTSHISKPNPIIQELSCRVCGIGFFLNSQTNYCNFCSDNCLTCNSASYCQSCNNSANFYLDLTSNTCMSCQSGYYVDPSTIHQCKPCSDNCLTCNSTSSCLSCNNSNGLYLNTLTNICVDCRQAGYYVDQLTNLCKPCSDNCLTCNSTSSCLSCNNSNGFYLDITSNTCMSCQSEYFVDLSTKLCISCPRCWSCNYSIDLFTNMTNNLCKCKQIFRIYKNQSVDICTLCNKNCSIDPEKNDLSPGIIAGISFGVIAFISIMILVILCLYRRKKKKTPETIIKQQQNKYNVSTQKIKSQSKSHNCAFCIEDNCNLIAQCQHQFHLQCLKQWMKKNKKCPVCQNENIEIVKIMICGKCQIYQYFDITTRKCSFDILQSSNTVKNHECIIQSRQRININ